MHTPTTNDACVLRNVWKRDSISSYRNRRLSFGALRRAYKWIAGSADDGRNRVARRHGTGSFSRRRWLLTRAGARVGKHQEENFQRKRDTESNRPTYRGPASLPPPTLLLPPISGLRVFDRIDRGARCSTDSDDDTEG